LNSFKIIIRFNDKITRQLNKELNKNNQNQICYNISMIIYLIILLLDLFYQRIFLI